MDPITLAIAALTFVAGGVVSGAAGKVGEPLGEAVVAKAKLLLGKLPPETRARLAEVSDPNAIDVKILEEVKRAAADSEVKAALDETMTAAAMERDRFPKLEKLAEKIGSVNFGTIGTQNNTFNF